MAEDFAIGLVLAGLTFTGWLAYNHPASFKRLLPWFMGASVIVWACVGTWMLAIAYAQAAVSAQAPIGKGGAYHDALAALQIPGWVFWISGPAALAYLSILAGWVARLKDRG